MRIIHTADWHIWDKHKYSINNSRLEQIDKNIKRIIKYAIKYKVDMIVITGDIFHVYNPDEKCMKILANNLRAAIICGIKVVLITGDHDTNGINYSLESIGEIVKEIGGDEIRIVDHKYGMFHHKINNTILTYIPFSVDILSDIETAKQWIDIDCVNLLFTHVGVDKAVTSTGKKIKNKVKLVDLKVWNYVGLGDYHMHQHLGYNVYYAGSIIKINKGERNDDKCFTMLDVDDKRKKVKRYIIDLLDIDFIELDLDVKYINKYLNGKIVDGKIQNENKEKIIKDSFVNLSIYNVGDKDSVDVYKLVNKFYSCGAKDVALNLNFKNNNLNMIGSDYAGLNLNITDAIEQHAKNNNKDGKYIKYGIEQIKEFL